MKLDKKTQQIGERMFEALNGVYPKRDYKSLKENIGILIYSYTPTNILQDWIAFGDYHPHWEEGLEAMVLIPVDEGCATLSGSTLRYSTEGIKALNYAISKEFSNPKTQSRKPEPHYTGVQVSPKNSVYYKSYLLSSAISLSGERIRLFPEYRKEVIEGLENASWDLDPSIVYWHQSHLEIEPAKNITYPSDPSFHSRQMYGDNYKLLRKKFWPNRGGREFLIEGKLIHRSPDEHHAMSDLARNINEIGGDFSNDKELTRVYFQIAKRICENMMGEDSWIPILRYLEIHNPDIADELSTEIKNPDNHFDFVSMLDIPINRSDLSKKIEESLR
jgi:hypothetical protein